MLPKRKHAKSARLAAALLIALSPLVWLAGPAQPAAAETADLTNTDVQFQSGALTLYGTVVAPTAAGTGRAGLVLVPGAGARTRDAYRPEAEAFARAGVVVLIYDKRSDYSRATSSFTRLADDAIAGVHLLRSRADVEPSRVGIWGHSEGGWVAPLAASRSTDIGFVIPVGASALHTDRTQLWSNRTYLSHAGVSASLWDPIGVNLSRMLVAANLFGDVGYDPIATLQKVHQPLLAVFGQYDRSTVPAESLRLYRDALDRAGNTHYTLRVIPDANHNMRRSTTGFDNAHASRFAPGYTDLITSWINDLGHTLPEASADPPPGQNLPSTPVKPLAWFENVALQLGLLAVMLIGFLAYPVGAVLRRLRRHRPPARVRWAARLLAASGMITVLGTSTYLFTIVATGATNTTTTLLGRPPEWLTLQLGALGVLATTAFTIIGCRRHGGSPRVGLLLTGGVVFIPWAAYWGLLTP
ncbi:prolyl oligopeptidase family serine peptidase [Dactylosporangium sp. NPDC049140]|jgi:dienelactone hydrolase|uniref:alpha/beta hydrolase family protein n=1 Tax=Dactylosporangium sp. NPDC049140 TaxID=3155647 RepID=UPI0033F25C79